METVTFILEGQMIHEDHTGALPYVLLMLGGIVILSVFPGIATWLPDQVMGPAR